MRYLSPFSSRMKGLMTIFMVMSLLSSPMVFAQELGEIDEESGVDPISVSENGPAIESEESSPEAETEDTQGNPDTGTESGSVGVESQLDDPLSPEAEEGNLDIGDGTDTQPETSVNEETTPEPQVDNLVEPASPDNQVGDTVEPNGVGTLTLTIVFEGEADITGESCFELRQDDIVINQAECLAPEDIIDGEGTVVFNALPAGIYTVVGSVVPDGWISGGPVENVVVVAEQNATASITITAEQSATASVTNLVEPAAVGYPMTILQRMCLDGISGGDCNRNNGMSGFSTTFTITGPGSEVQTTTVVIGAFGTPQPLSSGQRVIQNLPAGTYTVCQELIATTSGPPFPDFHTGPSTATLISLDGPCQTNTLPGDGGGGRIWTFHNQVDVLTSSQTGDLYITKYVCDDAALGGTAEIVWRQPSHCGPPVTAGFSLDVQRNGVSVLPPGHDLLVEPAELEIGTYTLVEDGDPVGQFAIGVQGLSLTVINYVGPDMGEVSLAKYVCEDEALAGTSAVVATAPADCGAPVSAGYVFDIVDSGGVSVLPAGSDLLAAPVTVPVGTGYQLIEDGTPLGAAFDVTTAGVSIIVVNYVVPSDSDSTLVLNLTSGSAGMVVGFNGEGYTPGQRVDIRFGGANGQLVGYVTASPAGTISGRITIPVSAGAGSHAIVATGPSNKAASATYTVETVVETTLVLASTSGSAGVVVGFNGEGYTPDQRVDIRFGGTNGRLVGYVNATPSGMISGAITIPVTTTAGEYTVVAIGANGKRAEAAYEVTGPTFVLSPTSGDAGVVIRFSGQGYAPGERVNIRFGGDNGRLVGYKNATDSGAIIGAITIPSTATAGEYTVVAIGANGKRAEAAYELTGPTIVLTSTSGDAGVVIRFSGQGYAPGERVDIRFGGANGRLVGYKNATDSGAISGAIMVPTTATAGEYTVVAIGANGKRAEATYTVRSAAHTSGQHVVRGFDHWSFVL